MARSCQPVPTNRDGQSRITGLVIAALIAPLIAPVLAGGTHYPEGVPILGAGDALPARPHRVLIAGGSGSGKTTLAAQIGSALGLPHTEIDALFHGPDWTPRESFVPDVERFSAEPDWVTEWQYNAVREVLAERADLMIWLDLPRRTVMRQVIRRTLSRRLRRESLWNGNQEPPFRTIFTDPEHIIRWAWSTHSRTAPRVLAVHERRPDLPIVRLTGRSAVDRWRNDVLHHKL
jgi:adenylate kinase family enzyme